MGKKEFFFNGTITPQQFSPIAGITTYNFVVIGAGGGGGSSFEAGNGGNGAVVNTTYNNITQSVNIVVGGGGGAGIYTIGELANSGGGAGLTQVFNNQLNIIAGGGGGGGTGSNSQGGVGFSGGAGGSGGNPNGGNGIDTIGGGGTYYLGGRGGNGSIGGQGGGGIGANGGSFNTIGSGSSGEGGYYSQGDFINTAGGGGGAGINGITGTGGNANLRYNGGLNGGGGSFNSGAGGGAGYGGGGGGDSGATDGGFGGGGGSSIALFNPASLNYSIAPYDNISYGQGGLGGQNGSINDISSGNGQNGNNGYVCITWSELANSNICFPAGTPIRTDQGLVDIDQINTSIHTIGKKHIKHITKTVTLDKYLISFQPSTLGRNIPNRKTLMSKDHKILFQGQLVPAYRFLDLSDQIKKIKYSGETLYNVLLDEYSTIDVNNLQCETLHPENIIAKLYTSTYTEEHKNNIICSLNMALAKRDGQEYKKILHTIL